MLSFVIFGPRSHQLPVPAVVPILPPAPSPMPDPAPALKDWFDPARYRHIAQEVGAIHPGFDAKKFLKLALVDLDSLSLMQRLRRTTESLHATLPSDYPRTLEILRQLAPRLGHSFVSLILPDYVALYGQPHFDLSLDALKFFTPFGSSEFAIRHFLQRDLPRTLVVMEKWSRDENDHVRRLASEGCRPRLPWSFRLEALIADPTPVLPILENLRADPSLYVRKSVANHLNDITKDHPSRVLDLLHTWPIQENPHTAWIARHALRTLIKKGDPQALGLIGASGKPDVKIHHFTVSPKHIQLGQKIGLSLCLESQATTPQRLVVDYALHYVKKSGSTSAKVFKWKEITLAPGETLTLTRQQTIQDFTTRLHHAGHHAMEIQINGETLAKSGFELEK
ncbi:3-methyladenine DNA glycosylase AlkC [Prosthecobacter dejongeii]|uniref:3-methyladenine DNA glycosylase AlkC n=2 Tax=Prosthecobacter dejongeii TaxID=48465 RepID=A0A7W8DNK2_9BACT|nr:DNA alkylation repair protein [Prosthecobacter dejongeii]MBB5036185.1 3-methyladenine DNA glycosylase AlkC [Prosthecobacter dejongeii]